MAKRLIVVSQLRGRRRTTTALIAGMARSHVRR
jgi:hypothetical protein